MKTLFSIILGLVIAGSGIAMAVNAKTQESICSELNHEGFSYPEGQTPPVNSSPTNLPPGMQSIGAYEDGFRCNLSDNHCHWTYQPAVGTTPGKWVPCKGDYEDLR